MSMYVETGIFIGASGGGGLYGHRKKVYDTDFSSLSDMVLYAYGRERKIKSKKDVERLLFVIKERIAEDKIETFRKNHNCKECYLLNKSHFPPHHL